MVAKSGLKKVGKLPSLHFKSSWSESDAVMFVRYIVTGIVQTS